MDENGVSIVNLQEEGVDGIEDVVSTESLFSPKRMLTMLEMMLAFHAWYKEDSHVPLRQTQKRKMPRPIRIIIHDLN